MAFLFNAIVMASDHAGFRLKGELLTIARQDPLFAHMTWTDLGTDNQNPVDYPDYAQRAVRALTGGGADAAILICGTGVGMGIAANRIPGIRAVLGNDGPTTVRLARAHNDANVLCLGQNIIGTVKADDSMRAFLSTPFDGGDRHVRRLKKID